MSLSFQPFSVVLPLEAEHECRFQANAGDSRSVMSVGGEAKPLSYDHKPTNAAETSRIVAAGGFVEFGRVNGEFFDFSFPCLPSREGFD